MIRWIEEQIIRQLGEQVMR